MVCDTPSLVKQNIDCETNRLYPRAVVLVARARASQMNARQATAAYYRRSFPADQVHRWATRNTANPENVEFGWESFDGKLFVRWKSCATPSDLRELVCLPNVGKLNVGAAYDVEPARRHQARGGMTVASRPLVFDIDLDDYNVGATKADLGACDRMWPLVAIGLTIVAAILRECFGFEQFVFVYSGRRGGHLWVHDERACALTDEARSAIASFLTPPQKNGRMLWHALANHPNFSPLSNELLLPFFKTTAIRSVDDGGLSFLELPFQRIDFVNELSPPPVDELNKNVSDLLKGKHQNQADLCERRRKALASEMECSDDPVAALKAIEKWVKYFAASSDLFVAERFAAALWSKLGPRIDVAVTARANHMLKAPYSVHPGSGRVSVPIPESRLFDFKPAQEAPHVCALAAGDAEAFQALEQSKIWFEAFVKNSGREERSAGKRARGSDDLSW